MTILIQCLVSGISIGAIYTMIALSYTILFGTLRVANFAQGDIYMIAILVGYTFYVNAALPFPVALVLSIVAAIIVLLFIERTIYTPVQKSSSMYLFICTIGMATFLRNGAQLIFGSESYAFPPLFNNVPIEILPGVSILSQNIAIIIVAVILVVALMLFMRKTKVGLAMTSMSMNPYAASIMGVNLKKITTLTYGISAAIVAIAGVFSAPIYNVNTTVGAGIGLKALIAAVLGGFGNPVGAILGGVLLGLIEALGSTYLSSAYKDAFSFIALLIILFLRPQGILGRKNITKV